MKPLQDHFHLVFRTLAAAKVDPAAAHDDFSFCSGIPYPFLNMTFGLRDIERQIRFFGRPFMWYLDEGSDFKQKLLDRGFQDGGMFRGIVRGLDHYIPEPEAIDGYQCELVQDSKTMDQFSEVLGSVFDIPQASRSLYQRFLWNEPRMAHWVAKKGGTVVSTLSTFMDGKVMSVWNAATLPEHRLKGLNTSLWRLASKAAASRGCLSAMSYLMADGMAFGICDKLGFHTKWRFHVFLSPT